MVAEQRWKDVDSGTPALTPAFPSKPATTIPDGLDPITSEFFEYYAMSRGFHPRSIAAFTITSDMSFLNFPLLHTIETIAPSPCLRPHLPRAEVKHPRECDASTYNLYAGNKVDPHIKNFSFPKWYMDMGLTWKQRQAAFTNECRLWYDEGILDEVIKDLNKDRPLSGEVTARRCGTIARGSSTCM